MQSESCHSNNKGMHSDVRRGEGEELRSPHVNQAWAEEVPSLFCPSEEVEFLARGPGISRGGVPFLSLSRNPIQLSL